jgi:hypothetical protein
MAIIKFLFSPVVFGFAFLAPLIAQSLTALGFTELPIDNIYIGLFVGGTLGLVAHIRGSWLWVKP